MNWRSDGQDYTTTFKELKIGITFFNKMTLQNLVHMN